LKKSIWISALAATMLSAGYPPAVQAGEKDRDNGAGGIAYHYVGRIKLNFADSTGIVYGYMTAVSGVKSTASLFNGTPGEATAYLTFRANVKFTPLPGNGPLGPGQFAVSPILTEAGTWSIYFTANPAHNWDNPDTFSNGQSVATFDRPVEQFSIYPTFSINAGAAILESSTPFTLGGQRMHLREITPRGLVDITSGTPVPLTGSTPTAPIFAFSGYSLVIGR
jgi:hypothetical protein